MFEEFRGDYWVKKSDESFSKTGQTKMKDWKMTEKL